MVTSAVSSLLKRVSARRGQHVPSHSLTDRRKALRRAELLSAGCLAEKEIHVERWGGRTSVMKGERSTVQGWLMRQRGAMLITPDRPELT